MKSETSEGWGIFERGALVLFDARCPVYWKRYIAKAEAEKHGLVDAQILKVRIILRGESA